MGNSKAVDFNAADTGPSRASVTPPQAQKHGSGLRDLITWQLAPMIGRILAAFGFYL